MPTTWAACRQTSCPRGEHAQSAQGGAGFSPGPSLAPPVPVSPHALVSQPAAAFPLRRLSAWLRQGHQSSGQVCGSQTAEHHGHQRRLHGRLAGEPRPPCLASSAPSGGGALTVALPVGGTVRDLPRPRLPAPGAFPRPASWRRRLLRLWLPQHPGQRSALPPIVAGVSPRPSSGGFSPPVSDLCPALPSLTSCLLAHLLQ